MLVMLDTDLPVDAIAAEDEENEEKGHSTFQEDGRGNEPKSRMYVALFILFILNRTSRRGKGGRESFFVACQR